MSKAEWKDMRAGKGCPACWKKSNDQIKKEHGGRKPMRALFSQALGDLLGDDEDGLAAELEDAEACGLLREEDE